MSSCPCLEREKRLSLCPVHALWCYVECTITQRHTNCSCLSAMWTERLCQYRGSLTGIWQAYVSAGRDPAAATWAHSAPSASTLRASFSGISEGRSVHRSRGHHSVCSSDFICLMCLGPLGLCSLVMRRTGLRWASCWHNLFSAGVKSSG